MIFSLPCFYNEIYVKLYEIETNIYVYYFFSLLFCKGFFFNLEISDWFLSFNVTPCTLIKFRKAVNINEAFRIIS